MSAQFLEFEKVERCPGCRSAGISPVADQDIAQCGTCQLYFRNPRPTQSEIARSYDTGGTFEAWQDEETARATMWQRRLAVLTTYAPGGRLLDVGTGDGRFLATAQEGGFAVVGTEVSTAGASYARERGFDVHLGQIIELDLPAGTFRCRHHLACAGTCSRPGRGLAQGALTPPARRHSRGRRA